MGGGEILKKGLLIKSPPLDSGALKNWRKRWFVLLSSKVLEYYKSEGGEQKGVVNLEDCHSVNSNLSHKRYKHVFNIETRDRVYFLVASSQADMESWVDALCRVCGLHTDTTPVIYAPPPCTSSKRKGPNITQPIYATSSSVTPNVQTGQPLDSVYSLAAKSEYGTGRNLKYNTTTNAPFSHVASYGTLGSSRLDSSGVSNGSGVSTGSGPAGSGSMSEAVAGNRLSETAFFSPHSLDSLNFLADEAGERDAYAAASTAASHGHKVVSKSRSATFAPSSLHEPLSGLENRSHTNALSYGGVYQQPTRRTKVSTQPRMAGNYVTDIIPEERTSDISPALLDKDSASRDEGYGILHMPPPIDRSRKPRHGSSNSESQSSGINQESKFRDRSGESDSSDSSDHDTEEQEWGNSQISNSESTAKEPRKKVGMTDHNSQFSVAEIPKVTVRTTHYTQVNIDPSKRRPIPVPRKTSAPSFFPKAPLRINYSDVDIAATSQLSDRLNRQMTVREAEQKALSQKHYINVDRSGLVDDETNPDYYTHMRDFYCYDAEEPDNSSEEMHGDEDT